MKNMQKWAGLLLVCMGVVHSMLSDWTHLNAAARQGWWMSVDTLPESRALWFFVAGIALIIIGLLALNSLTTRLAAAMLVLLLMLVLYTGTGLMGAGIGVIAGLLLLLGNLLPTQRTNNAA